MNLGLSKLERAVRERVLADVQQSDAMWEVYRKRRWVRRLRQAVVVLSSAVAVPCLLGVGVIWPLFLTTLCIGLGAVGPPGSHQNPYPDPHYLEGNGIEVALLLQALFVTSWTLVWLASQTKALRQSRKLAMLAFLPLSDAEHRRQVLRASLWSHALAMAYFTLFGYAYWARSENFTIGGRLAIAVLMVLQGGTSAAMLAWLQGRFSSFAMLLQPSFYSCFSSLEVRSLSWPGLMSRAGRGSAWP